MRNDWIYDCEVYPNVFTIAFQHATGPFGASFEISEYRNDSNDLRDFLNFLHSTFARMVGFNNVGFDYPLIHHFIRAGGRGDYRALYEKCQAIIGVLDKQDRWSHLVKPSDRFLPQLDLYLINHFDNAARATSLKALEFNMRADSIEDLPFPPGTRLTREQIEVLKKYNAYDVTMTKRFYHHCKQQIAFREELTEKYHRDFTNHNDTAIGKTFFQMELEKAGVTLYDYSPSTGRTPRQTPRPVIHLRDAILPSIYFDEPDLARVLRWFKEQSITETKGVFKDIIATVNHRVFEQFSNIDSIPGVEGVIRTLKPELTARTEGFELVFGLGGIHGSVENEIIESDENHVIIDIDVQSYYPNLAIQNVFYPEHLGEPFVHIYKRLFEQRKSYDKKSAESAMLKLALNGVYGDSGNKYSVFYDPLFTMKITLNGQLLLAMLCEDMMAVPGLRLIQCNTDGATVRLPRSSVQWLQPKLKSWQNRTGLVLEQVEYTKMCIADVNSYIAVKEDGSTKRKGRYEYQLGWHQDASALVVPKVAEKVLVEGVPIRKTVEEWPDVMDFMCRVKVPRSGVLKWGDEPVQNTTRYLVTTNGKPLTKILPPTPKQAKEGRTEWRSFAVEASWNVEVCNDMRQWGTDIDPKFYGVNYDYYVQAVEKLTLGLK